MEYNKTKWEFIGAGGGSGRGCGIPPRKEVKREGEGQARLA